MTAREKAKINQLEAQLKKVEKVEPISALVVKSEFEVDE